MNRLLQSVDSRFQSVFYTLIIAMLALWGYMIYSTYPVFSPMVMSASVAGRMLALDMFIFLSLLLSVFAVGISSYMLFRSKRFTASRFLHVTFYSFFLPPLFLASVVASSTFPARTALLVNLEIGLSIAMFLLFVVHLYCDFLTFDMVEVQ